MVTQRLRDEWVWVGWGRSSSGHEVELNAPLDLKTAGGWAAVRWESPSRDQEEL